jgi:peptidoglycan/xylan/chitin deacetylase (PgdA/CDA1 family)
VISTTLATFRRQMKYLSVNGYNTARVSDVPSLLSANAETAKKTIILTFDDGFRNFYTEAFPILQEHGFAATVFVVTDFLGKYNDWPGNPTDFPRSELMSLQAIRELDKYGIEFGSHTRSHPDLTKLDIDDVTSEVVGSQQLLSDALGRPPTSFAYPFGKRNALVKQMAKRTYSTACTTNLGKATKESDLAELERIDSFYLGRDTIFERFESTGFDYYLTFRQSLRTIRSLLN